MRKETMKNAFGILINEGPINFVKHTIYHVNYMKKKKAGLFKSGIKDILFINGCPIDYCERYRVHHKMEELISYGFSVDELPVCAVSEHTIKYYRAFIIYRTPWDKHMDKIVKIAKENNKVVFYDIDDLVFDLNYTNSIKELKKLTKEERKVYDDGVKRYGRMLDCCDYGITSTSIIANEMKKHVKDICIDKNIASLKMQKYSELAIKEIKKDDSKVIIGYASGSLTHNADFKLISTPIQKLMDKYENVYLKLIGAIDVPDEFKKYGKRVIISEFVDYTKLPHVLRSLDINLAPLENTFFNSAKSSIKWMEAGLVKVPTIASNVGNFHETITDGIDGILCNDDEWFDKLEKMVTDYDYRIMIGKNAYKTVYNSYTPVSSGKDVSNFIKSKLNHNIFFVLPAANISGGIMVATKHASILKQNGYDVTMLNMDLDTQKVEKMFDKDTYINVISTNNLITDMSIDTMVATMWFTLMYARSYPKVTNIKYLVQGRENDFYKPDCVDIMLANSSYTKIPNVEYLTVSKWCEKWLKDEFGVNAKYIPNGIDLSIFPNKRRNYKNKIKILIEGDSSSEYKNVDESFKITNSLDHNKYEIIYLSYNGEPKDWYNVDKFYSKIDHNEVYKIYQEADILLKSSYLESFSYPPLEMMATGGLAVVVPNDGNIEYLKDGENCLLYNKGDIESAIQKIETLVNDKKLREKLEKNGLITVKNRDWKKIEQDIIDIYSSK